MILASVYFFIKFAETTDPKIRYDYSSSLKSFDYKMGESEVNFFLLVSNPEEKVVVRKSSDPQLSDTDDNEPTDENPFDPNYDAENEELLDPYDTSTPTDDSATDDPSTGGERRRRRLEQLATPKFPYLDYDSFNLYFQGSLRYEIVIFKTTKEGGTYKSIKIGDKKLIKCSESGWFKNPKYKTTFDQSPFPKFLIEKFGICFDLEDDLILTGDTMSIQSSQLSFNMRICKAGTGSCLADAEDKVNQAKEMTVTVGALEPYVDNTLKEDYWMYGLNTDTILSLDYIQTTFADTYLGKTEVETDYGWLVEMKEQQTRGKIDRVRTEFSSKITLGQSTGNPDEFDTRFIRSDSLLGITFLASRNAVKISRSYDTLLDTFGSIGGSIDFLIFLITFFFHWYENINSNREVRGAVA